MSTIIDFDGEHSEAVIEPIHEVEMALRTAMVKEPPLAKLTRVQDETPIRVNASLVRVLWERDTNAGK
jgi:hypothetical protein